MWEVFYKGEISMRKNQSKTLEERIKENIRSIQEDQSLLDQIDDRIDKRHHDRLNQIPS
ncbi:FbpB family small basic protein [Halobacillus salinus]|uniref:FbpB family small basic protein n=1 Tax=Halobacillus salinus TaxID=192814 RepID=A0A4Z0H450_9BACI|nr:FbpB family small basic protein [Halobacillus salinus]